MTRLRVLTWHVHGGYLHAFARVPHDVYVPVRPGRPEGYGGRSPGRAWPPNLIEVPAEQVPELDLDVVVSQSTRNWEVDRPALLTPEQGHLPAVHIEHDPPRAEPTGTRHPVDDPDALVVHVTAFNELMWHTLAPTCIVDHGVTVPEHVRYQGDLERGIVVVNDITRRGRRLGADVLAAARAHVPLDLAGMGADAAGPGALGDLGHDELLATEARYRFLFNPIRYTSLGLSVCEAMMVGLPVVGLATTEMVTAVEQGVSGWLDTDPARLVGHMRRLLADPDEARRLSEGARRRARERFGIDRFVDDWDRVLRSVVERGAAATATTEHERRLDAGRAAADRPLLGASAS